MCVGDNLLLKKENLLKLEVNRTNCGQRAKYSKEINITITGKE